MKTGRSPLMAIICMLGLLAGSVHAFAQEKTQTKPIPQKPGRVEGKVVTPAKLPPGEGPTIWKIDDGTFKFVAGKFASGKLVTGAPYSATAVTESTQTLSDGNQIVRKNEAKVYRDSEGRTRIDQRLETIGKWSANGEAPMMTIISDPVAGISYSLDHRTRTVHKNIVKQPKPAAVNGKPLTQGEIEVLAEKKRKASEAAPPGERTYVVDGRTVSQAEAEAIISEKTRRAQEEMSKGGPKSPALTKRPSPASPGKFALSGERKTESLGTQVIEGVTAEGTRTTLTIPAGEIGNVLPLEIIDENWYSSELQLQVMTKHQDPRSGVVLYRLTNLNRSEPDRSLFEIPEGYTVNERSVFQPKPARKPPE